MSDARNLKQLLQKSEIKVVTSRKGKRNLSNRLILIPKDRNTPKERKKERKILQPNPLGR